MAKSAKPNPFAKGAKAAAPMPTKGKMPMKGAKPPMMAGKGGKGMVAPPAKKAK